MSKKVYSLRLREDIVDLINQQPGDSFTERFEGLVTKCVWEVPHKEQELKDLDKEIKRRQKKLSKLGANLTWSLTEAQQTVQTMLKKINDNDV